MHRIDADAHVGNQFSDGDAGLGQPGTKCDSAWLNAVQEELAAVIEAAGITLVKGTNTQLLAACVAAATANRIVRRDAAGRAQFADPSAAADAATKAYVDASRILVAGKVNGTTGAIITQTGPLTASSSRSFAGSYNVVVPGLTADAIVLLTIWEGSDYRCVYFAFAGSFDVNVFNSAGALADRGFSFLVVKL